MNRRGKPLSGPQPTTCRVATSHRTRKSALTRSERCRVLRTRVPEALCPARVGVVPAHVRGWSCASPGNRGRRGHEADCSASGDSATRPPPVVTRARPADATTTPTRADHSRAADAAATVSGTAYGRSPAYGDATTRSSHGCRAAKCCAAARSASKSGSAHGATAAYRTDIGRCGKRCLCTLDAGRGRVGGCSDHLGPCDRENHKACSE
jgi:hypothetical protein